MNDLKFDFSHVVGGDGLFVDILNDNWVFDTLSLKATFDLIHKPSKVPFFISNQQKCVVKLWNIFGIMLADLLYFLMMLKGSEFFLF